MVSVLLAGQEPLSGSDAALITRYVRIGRRPTTFRLEAATWNLLCAIAHRQNLTVDDVCGDIAEVTAEDADLAAASSQPQSRGRGVAGSSPATAPNDRNPGSEAAALH